MMYLINYSIDRLGTVQYCIPSTNFLFAGFFIYGIIFTCFSESNNAKLKQKKLLFKSKKGNYNFKKELLNNDEKETRKHKIFLYIYKS